MKTENSLFRRVWLLPVVLLVLLASCRTCPIASCHVRKVHLHGTQKYRGQPLWKKQNPAIGEKIKVHNEAESEKRNDRSKAKP